METDRTQPGPWPEAGAAPASGAPPSSTLGAPVQVPSPRGGAWLRGRSWILLAGLYLVSAALAARLLTSLDANAPLVLYLGLLGVFFVLFSVIWVFPRMPQRLVHLILALQCLVVLGLLLIEPEYDYMASLFVPLSYQAAVVFSGRARRVWVGLFLVLIVVSLTSSLGLRGLGLSLTPMAVAVTLAAMAAAGSDIERARTESQQMVTELAATHEELARYAAEAETLAAMVERNRLVRELHDSVSQSMFAILLSARSAQLEQQRDPEKVPAQLEQLRDLTQDALARMRGFIAELRRPDE